MHWRAASDPPSIRAVPSRLSPAAGPAGSSRSPARAPRHDGSPLTRSFYAAPAHAIRAIAWPDSVDRLAAPLRGIPYAPLTALTLGFRREHVSHSLNGLGMVVPTGAPYAIRGALFASSLFPGRAPVGHVAMTCMVGGPGRDGLASATTETIEGAVVADLRRLVGVRGEPSFVHRTTSMAALPQYELGHDAVDHAVSTIEAAHPGLYLGGGWLGGVGIDACIPERASARPSSRRRVRSGSAARHASWHRRRPDPDDAPPHPASPMAPAAVDVLAIAAHPDDIELTCGGALLRAQEFGRQTAIIDLTAGETGTRGTPTLRASEAAKAAAMLGVRARENLGLPDAGIVNTPETRTALARLIRRFTPRVVIAPAIQGRHPDHSDGGGAGSRCVFRRRPGQDCA